MPHYCDVRVDFVTLFPEMLELAFGFSILKRAVDSKIVSYCATNPRDFTSDKHRTVDDKPFGGGPGMLMKPQPIDDALQSLNIEAGTPVIMPDPTGPLFTQSDAESLGLQDRLIFICGHYEGIDQRICDKWATHKFSLGDYILTGGELPSLVMTDSIIRSLKGVLGNQESLDIDSLGTGLLSAPQYTRPEIWDNYPVPSVLLSGNHALVERWKRKKSLQLTRSVRPDLFAKAPLDYRDLELLLEADDV